MKQITMFPPEKQKRVDWLYKRIAEVFQEVIQKHNPRNGREYYKAMRVYEREVKIYLDELIALYENYSYPAVIIDKDEDPKMYSRFSRMYHLQEGRARAIPGNILENIGLSESIKEA